MGGGHIRGGPRFWPVSLMMHWWNGGHGGVCLGSVSKVEMTIFTINWLRVLDTAEPSQIDQRVCHHLHAIVPLLDALEP